MAEQKTVLEGRRDAACKELRQSRDQRYQALLGEQQEIRADLRGRQAAGIDSADFLADVGSRQAKRDNLGLQFCTAAGEVTRPEPNRVDAATAPERRRTRGAEDYDPTGPINLGFVGSLLESLFFAVTLETPRPPERDPEEWKPFEAAAEETRKQQQQLEREEADAELRRRQRSPYGD